MATLEAIIANLGFPFEILAMRSRAVKFKVL